MTFISDCWLKSRIEVIVLLAQIFCIFEYIYFEMGRNINKT